MSKMLWEEGKYWLNLRNKAELKAIEISDKFVNGEIDYREYNDGLKKHFRYTKILFDYVVGDE